MLYYLFCHDKWCHSTYGQDRHRRCAGPCQRVAAERATLFPNLLVVGEFSFADPVCTHLAPGRYDCLSDMFVGDHHVQ